MMVQQPSWQLPTFPDTPYGMQHATLSGNPCMPFPKETVVIATIALNPSID